MTSFVILHFYPCSSRYEEKRNEFESTIFLFFSYTWKNRNLTSVLAMLVRIGIPCYPKVKHSYEVFYKPRRCKDKEAITIL